MEKQNKRSSILKRPVTEESTDTFTRSTRRISFSGMKNVKEFMPVDGGATIWITSYEESAESAPAPKGKLYTGPQATPELVMRLRNNKVISKIPQNINSKANRRSKGVQNPPSVVMISHEQEEQAKKKQYENFDISLSVSEIEKLTISNGQERLPLQPLAQPLEQIEDDQTLISPQTSLTSPFKVYCSFSLTKKEIAKLTKLDSGKQLDFTLTDIITESEKKTLNANNQDVYLSQMDVINETNVVSSQKGEKPSKTKRETMFNLENMDLVSVQKNATKRSKIYYFDNLELSLKNNQKQRISYNRTKFDTLDGFQEENMSVVDDCDKENRPVYLENNDMEVSFASIVDSMKFSLQEESVDIENSPVRNLGNVKNSPQTKEGLKKNALINQFNALKGNELYKENLGNEMDMSLSPAGTGEDMHISDVKFSGNPQTLYYPSGFNLTMQNKTMENKKYNNMNCIRIDEDQRNETVFESPIIYASDNQVNDDMVRSKKRQTVSIPCNLDVTLQNDTRNVHENDNTRPEYLQEDSNIKTKCLGKRLTVYDTCDLDITLENKTQLPDILVDEKMEEEISECRERRRTVHTACDLELSFQENLQLENYQSKHNNKEKRIFEDYSKIELCNKNSFVQGKDDLRNEDTLKSTIINDDSGDRICTSRRKTVNVPCSLDFTLQNNTLNINEKNSIRGGDRETLKPLNNKSKYSERRFAVDDTGNLDMTLENEVHVDNNKLNDKIPEKVGNKTPEENIKHRERRGTVYTTCDLELTMQESINDNNSEKTLEDRSEMETCTNLLPRSPFAWGKTRMNYLTKSVSKDECNSPPYEKEISKGQRRTMHATYEMDLTMQGDDQPSNENIVDTKFKSMVKERTNSEKECNECMDLSIDNLPISKLENEIRCHEKSDSKVRHPTVYTRLDFDLTLNGESQGSFINPNSKEREHRINKTCNNENTIRYPCNNDMECGIFQQANKNATINSELEQQTIYTNFGMDCSFEKDVQSHDTKSVVNQTKEYISNKISSEVYDNMLQIANQNEATVCEEKRRAGHANFDMDYTIQKDVGSNHTNLVKIISNDKQDKILQETNKRKTVHTNFDMDFIFTEGIESNSANTIEINLKKVNVAKTFSNNMEHEILEKTSHDELIIPKSKRRTVHAYFDMDISFEEDLENNFTKPVESDLISKTVEQGVRNAVHAVEREINHYELINSKIKRRTISTPIDMELEEGKDLNISDIINKKSDTALEYETSKTINENQATSKVKRQTIYTPLDLNASFDKEVEQSYGIQEGIKVIGDKLCTTNSYVVAHGIMPIKNAPDNVVSKVKRQTIFSPLNLDLTLEEEVKSSIGKETDTNLEESKNAKRNSRDILKHSQLGMDIEEETEGASANSIKDLNIKKDMVITKTDEVSKHAIPQEVSENDETIFKAKRQTICSILDLDLSLEEDVKSSFGKQSHSKERADKREPEIYAPKNLICNTVDIQQSPTSAPIAIVEKITSKENVIFSTKRQAILEHWNLDSEIEIDSKASEIQPLVDKSPQDCMALERSIEIDDNNLKYNSKNNTISSKVRQTTDSPVNLNLTVQNDLTDANKMETITDTKLIKNHEQSIEMKSNLHHKIESLNPSEFEHNNKIIEKYEQYKNSVEKNERRSSCLPMEIEKLEECIIKKEEHESESSKNQGEIILNKSPDKSCGTDEKVQPSLQNLERRLSAILQKSSTAFEANDSSVQILNCTIEQSAMENSNFEDLMSSQWIKQNNSLKNVNFLGFEQLSETSTIFCDSPSRNITDLDLDQASQNSLETSIDILRCSRPSSCQITSSTFSANTTEALCNIDTNKITKKGYKKDLKTIQSCSDQIYDSNYEFTPPLSMEDSIEKINLNTSNFNCTNKDVNLKNDNCENNLKNRRSCTVENAVSGQQSFCSKCKACDCKPTREQNKDISRLSWKFEAPRLPHEVDFSRYEKYQTLPSVRDVFEAHKTRRESLNFESCEESVFNPTVPSMDFLLENYANQCKLKVEKDIPVGAVFPLIPSMDILLSNKLHSEHFGWKLNSLCMPVGVMEFRHNNIPSVTLMLKYSPNSFHLNENKISFEKVQLKISSLYGNSSPFDKIIENEICLKTPYDLISYCPNFNNLFGFLSFMNNICESAIQLGKELFKRVVCFNGSIEKDPSNVYFIKKTVRYAKDYNQTSAYMNTQDFLVRVKNIEKISHADIMLPPLSDFKNSIYSLPEGLEFLTKFFSEPVSYLKTAL